MRTSTRRSINSIPIPEFKTRLEEAKQIMVNASIDVVGGQ